MWSVGRSRRLVLPGQRLIGPAEGTGARSDALDLHVAAFEGLWGVWKASASKKLTGWRDGWEMQYFSPIYPPVGSKSCFFGGILHFSADQATWQLLTHVCVVSSRAQWTGGSGVRLGCPVGGCWAQASRARRRAGVMLS